MNLKVIQFGDGKDSEFLAIVRVIPFLKVYIALTTPECMGSQSMLRHRLTAYATISIRFGISMSNLMITEAAKPLNGKASVATFHRHTKTGVLSYISNAQGNKVVDVAELERVYGPLKNGNGSHENAEQEKIREVENTGVVDVLREQVVLLKSQLETANREKKSVLRILENQTLMLPTPKKRAVQLAALLASPKVVGCDFRNLY